MPGSSETLEEMMCSVSGDLIQEGCVEKLQTIYIWEGTPLKDFITIGHMSYMHYIETV